MIYILVPEQARRMQRALDLLEHDHEWCDTWSATNNRHELPQDHWNCLTVVEPWFMTQLVRANGIDHVLAYADRNWIIIGNDIMNSSCWRTFGEIAPIYRELAPLFDHKRIYRLCDDSSPQSREIPILSSWWYKLDIGSLVAPHLNQPLPRENRFFAAVNAYRPWRQLFLELVNQQGLCANNYVIYHGHQGSDSLKSNLVQQDMLSDWIPRRLPWPEHIEYEACYINHWYRQFALELVVESTAHESLVTEKTVRPILGQLPFVTMAGAGHLAYLRSIGFRTFEGLIDESYDSETDRTTRMHMVVQVLKNLADQPNGFLELYKRSTEIRQHNFQHLFYMLGRQDLDYSISLQKFIDQCKIPTSTTPDPSWKITKKEYYQSQVANNRGPWLTVDSGKDHYLNKDKQ